MLVDGNQLMFGLENIGQIAIPVKNLDEAVKFYRDVLGMKFLFQAPPGLAFFDCNGIRLLLDVPSGENKLVRSSIIYYKVADIEAAYHQLSKRGVQFDGKPGLVAKMPDHDLWMVFFKDPDENVLALMSEIR